MAKLRKKHNKSLVILIPVLMLVAFAMFLTYSFANYRVVKIYNLVAANFNMNAYTLSYDVLNCSSKTVNNNQAYGELCNPATPDGYSFAGWYLGNKLITSTTKVRTTSDITLTAHFVSDCTSLVNHQYNFYYTGSVAEFTAPCPGDYQLEVWGAQGGDATGYDGLKKGGYGGYSMGAITLAINDKLNIVVGGGGNSTTAYNTFTEVGNSYNGGGGTATQNYNNQNGAGGGGGATHIATYDSNYTTLASYGNSTTAANSVYLVAGGGGAACVSYETANHSGDGGAGGGITGVSGTPSSTHSTSNAAGGTQSAAGNNTYHPQITAAAGFGTGCDPLHFINSAPGYMNSAGGAGWYGGACGVHGGAGGGSGYINNSDLIEKHMHCYNCTTSSVAETKTTTNACHSQTPTPDCAKEGNGHARITYLGTRPSATRPTFTTKYVQADMVYLVFSVGNNNPSSMSCYYGYSETEINNLGIINNNVCGVPPTAAYAKLCIMVNDVPICSVNKKLGEYVIKDGIMNYPFQPSVAEVTMSQGNGYLHVEIGNNNRLGIQLSGFDASPYNSVFADLSYIIDVDANKDPGINFFGYGTGSFFTRDGTDRIFESSIVHLEKQSTPVRVEQPRTVYPTSFIVDTSDASVYGNSNIGIGKNSVGTNEFVIDIYNIIFQYRD